MPDKPTIKETLANAPTARCPLCGRPNDAPSDCHRAVHAVFAKMLRHIAKPRRRPRTRGEAATRSAWGSTLQRPFTHAPPAPVHSRARNPQKHRVWTQHVACRMQTT